LQQPEQQGQQAVQKPEQEQLAVDEPMQHLGQSPTQNVLWAARGTTLRITVTASATTICPPSSNEIVRTTAIITFSR
jgi:hypothetical protein